MITKIKLKKQSFICLIICVGLVSAFSGCWEGSSPLGVSDVDEVSEIDVVGVRADSDFETTGLVSVQIVPRQKGEYVKPAGIRNINISSDDPSYNVYSISQTEIAPDTETELAGVILLDSTGSMTENDPDRLRVDASHLFIDQIGSSEIPFTLAAFDFGGIRSNVECFSYTRILQDYTQDIQALRSGVEQTIARGSTPLYHSVSEVIREDLGLRFRGDKYRRVILLLSDGRNNMGGTLDEVAEEVRKHEVVIRAVSLGANTDERALSNMARESDGSTVNVMNAESLLNMFDGIATTLTESYLETEVRIDPVPPSGTRLSLHIEANSGYRPVTATAEFTAP